MEIYTVSLFGHRKIDDIRGLEKKIRKVIKGLIESKNYICFMIGRAGEFDEIAASVIKMVQKELDRDNSEIVLVLPYKVRDIEFYEAYYHDIIIPPSACSAHPKYAITAKNRWMIEKSDMIIAFVEHNSGGAFEAIKYAMKMGKNVINLYTL